MLPAAVISVHMKYYMKTFLCKYIYNAKLYLTKIEENETEFSFFKVS